MSRIRRTIGLVSTISLLLLGTALVGTAAAANPGCGDTITANTTLTADVGPCNVGDGLEVTGSNITLDLAGHQVFSNAPLPRTVGVCLPGDANCIPADVVGIYLHGVTNTTVKNGTVTGFSAGVVIEFGGSNRITGITARDNRGPCIGEDFSTQAQGSFGDGFVTFSSANNRIENNQAIHNGPFSGIALANNTTQINFPVAPSSNGNLVSNNNVDNNRTCFADIGIRVEGPGASNNRIVGNKVNRSFQEGVAIGAVNNVDFRGLFAVPPTCQNRGFPSEFTANFTAGSPVITLTAGTFSAADVGKTITIFLPGNLPPGSIDPFNGQTARIASVQTPTSATATINVVNSFTGRQFSLRPQCPGKTGTARTPTNDNNIVGGNTVTNGGFGGQEDPPRGRAQVENAAGISMISFCQGNATTGPLSLNGKGNVFQGNTATGNASDGVRVGGCAATAVQTGFTNSRILGNTSVGNNKGTAGAGFDLRDTNPNCDANVWQGNRYGTANPACTTVGGTHITSLPAAAAQAAEGSADAGAARPMPLRGSHRG